MRGEIKAVLQITAVVLYIDDSLFSIFVSANTMATPQTKGKIAVVLGARGGTGKMIVNRLCEQGTEAISEVRAVVRNNKSSTPEQEKAIFPKDERVRVIYGDVTDLESLRPAFSGSHLIFNASSGSGSRDSKVVEKVDRDSVGNTANFLSSEFSQSVERYVLVTSQFVHPSNKWNPIRIMLNTIITGPFHKGIMDFKWEGEMLLRKSAIPYTIVRPGRLMDEPYPKGTAMKVTVGQTNASLGKPISRYDVAGVCIAAAMSDKAKNTTFELGSEPMNENQGQVVTSNASIPKDLFDNLQPRFLET